VYQHLRYVYVAAHNDEMPEDYLLLAFKWVQHFAFWGIINSPRLASPINKIILFSFFSPLLLLCLLPSIVLVVIQMW
jgi:hypothetical protein